MEDESARSSSRRGRAKSLKRRRDGCMNCRRKKRKCCQKTKERCQWNQPLKFRPENALTIPDTPDTLHGAGPVSSDASADGQIETPELVQVQGQQPPKTTDVTAADLPKPPDAIADPPDPTASNVQTGPYNADQAADLESALFEPPSLDSYDVPHTLNSTNSSFPVTNIVSPTATFYPAAISAVGSPPPTSSSTTSDQLKSDGVFLPGSEFREFHNLLRDGMFNTMAADGGSVPPSRPLSTGVGLDRPYSPPAPPPLPQEPQQPVSQNQNQARSSLGTVSLLTPELEADLWKNWIDEVSTWIDKFDPHQHFRHTLPMMAQRSAHLRYSILALSARQLEMRDKVLPEELSLALYQEAIHGVLPAMETRDTAVIASCVVLCVLEMLSCSPKMWRRHLDGCANLIMTLDIRGDCGGVEQALFWCIVRMDVCGGLILSESTLVPVDRWTSNAHLAADSAMFASATAFEQHANHALLLLAHVLALLAHPPAHSYTASWTALHAALQSWSATRPAQMHPVVTRPSAPFDTLIFTSGAAISGNQLHHTALLLLLQRRPRGARLPPDARSALWHARRICAISLSNAHRGCWTNSIQPLWIAGQLMSHPTEHEALLRLFKRIEDETGWATAWRARDLRAHWGDLSC